MIFSRKMVRVTAVAFRWRDFSLSARLIYIHDHKHIRWNSFFCVSVCFCGYFQALDCDMQACRPSLSNDAVPFRPKEGNYGLLIVI